MPVYKILMIDENMSYKIALRFFFKKFQIDYYEFYIINSQEILEAIFLNRTNF